MTDRGNLPDWPRGLSADMAGPYVGVSKTKFLEEVDAGLWPKADTRGGRKIWDRKVLDAYYDRRSGLAGTNPERQAMDMLDQLS